MALTVEQIAVVLREHRTELEALGVVSLSVFGSVARGEARDDSDIDVLVEFAAPTTFLGYMDLALLLEDLFDTPVDLVTRQAVRDEMRAQILAEARRVA